MSVGRGGGGDEQLTAQLSEITSRLERLQQTLDPGGAAEARSTPR